MLVLVSHQNFQECLLALYSNVLVLNHVSPHFQLLLTTIEIYTIPMSHYTLLYWSTWKKTTLPQKTTRLIHPWRSHRSRTRHWRLPALLRRFGAAFSPPRLHSGRSQPTTRGGDIIRDMEVSIVMGVPQNEWFIWEILLKIDDNWGTPMTMESSTFSSGGPEDDS